MTGAPTSMLDARAGEAPRGASPRWELLRALGSLTSGTPRRTEHISRALGLAPWDPAEHTRLFVLELPPYASIHLGGEGKLGGEGADRIAGIWRALGLDPPKGADHLCALLALYAELGGAGELCATDAARRRMRHASAAVLHEHLVSWLPGYLAAVESDRSGAGWALLMRAALRDEVVRSPLPVELPVALRAAPPPIDPSIGYDDLLDALTAPIRVGFPLTYADLVAGARTTGVGVRHGERRFALRSMFEQDPAETTRWLASHARRWAATHRRHTVRGPAAEWWERRAQATAVTLGELARASALR